MSTVTVGVACEDNGHFFAVKCLVDSSVIEQHTWLDGVLESCRRWCGLDEERPWYKFDPRDAFDLRPVTIDGMRIPIHGHIGGEPQKPEAGMWRKVLLMFCHAKPRPDVVILARDLDGYPERREGLLQVRDKISWPFKIAIATAAPEIEAWHISGFVPQAPEEQKLLNALKQELSFDPTSESHRLTSHPNDVPTDSKRVMKHLFGDDEERKSACLADRERLRTRGEKNGLVAFLREVDEHVVPTFGTPR